MTLKWLFCEVKLDYTAFNHEISVYFGKIAHDSGQAAISLKICSVQCLVCLCWMSDKVCLLQKRKVEPPVPLAPQVSPATPVPSLPSSAEASQASVFPAVRETNTTFKAREEHEPISSLTTVKKILFDSYLTLSLSILATNFNVFEATERHCPTTHPCAAWEEEKS